MGQLVFQATLGGQVNLVGPNTASTLNINVPATAGTMVTTGDSGTVTSTMLASNVYTAPGTIGSGTPNTGAFTTLSASSTVSGTGFSTYLASPPAIGGTAAAAGTFTTLSGTTSVTTPIVKSASSLTLQSNGTTTAVTIDTSQNVGIGTTSPSYKLNVSAGTTNATTYTPVSTIGGSTLYVQQQQTTSVSTSAVVILTPGLYGSLCLVHGSDGTNRFQDLIMAGLGTGTINVINSMSIAGTPASRTYTQVASAYRVAMGSGTYTVQVSALSMSS